ncbi:hypothetical protein P691DRAFT_790116 [Macrolepiota fuliginosa MF-IS2]|uniref:Uncharacterized protein n=1 Tax=Macrolepiota fuliginosa MF-IS2 TaxID=1400762 RepID=A0A9P5WZM1_9AGAR|nr:hypothetical protein P691DRAFT_790116 [Macrolepiota fuliginosa MF-IS2]
MSINTFNITEPPLSLKLGQFNPQNLSNAGIKQLVDSFVNEGFSLFKMESMILILLRAEDLEPAYINMDIAYRCNSPYLVLICSGNYRIHTIKEVEKLMDKDIAELRKKQKGLYSGKRKRKEKAKVARKGKGKGKGRGKRKNVTVASLDADIHILESYKISFQIWGIVVYNYIKRPLWGLLKEMLNVSTEHFFSIMS